MWRHAKLLVLRAERFMKCAQRPQHIIVPYCARTQWLAKLFFTFYQSLFYASGMCAGGRERQQRKWSFDATHPFDPRKETSS